MKLKTIAQRARGKATKQQERKSMASTQGKFGALAELNGRRPPMSSPAAIAPAAAFGRKLGKRSNPEFKQYSVLLKKASQREATDILRRLDDGRDFGDLVQSLLEDWLGREAKQ